MKHINIIPTKEATTKLTGSEKQVSWAEDIRAKFLDALFGHYEDGEEAGLPELSKHVDGFYDKMWNPAEKNEQTETVLMNMIEAQTSAKWWIDHRGSGDSWVVATLRGLAQK